MSAGSDLPGTSLITMRQVWTDVGSYAAQEQTINPESNIQSFDNVFYGALQVIIIAGANGWAPTMYDMMDSDFYTASIFFIVCIVILNFWLVNMFVAVITNTFGAIRAETKKSAFGAGTCVPIINPSCHPILTAIISGLVQ